MRVTVSRWEQVWLRRNLVGTVERLGDMDTRRANTAKIRWDCGYHDKWWQVTSLIPLVPPPQEKTE